MIDVKKLAEKAGAHHSAVTSAHCFRPRELEAFAALVLGELQSELQRDLDRPEGRWGLHGRSCVDDDYFAALQYVVKRIDELKPAKEQKT